VHCASRPGSSLKPQCCLTAAEQIALSASIPHCRARPMPQRDYLRCHSEVVLEDYSRGPLHGRVSMIPSTHANPILHAPPSRSGSAAYFHGGASCVAADSSSLGRWRRAAGKPAPGPCIIHALTGIRSCLSARWALVARAERCSGADFATPRKCVEATSSCLSGCCLSSSSVSPRQRRHWRRGRNVSRAPSALCASKHFNLRSACFCVPGSYSDLAGCMQALAAQAERFAGADCTVLRRPPQLSLFIIRPSACFSQLPVMPTDAGAGGASGVVHGRRLRRAGPRGRPRRLAGALLHSLLDSTEHRCCLGRIFSRSAVQSASGVSEKPPAFVVFHWAWRGFTGTRGLLSCSVLMRDFPPAQESLEAQHVAARHFEAAFALVTPSAPPSAEMAAIFLRFHRPGGSLPAA